MSQTYGYTHTAMSDAQKSQVKKAVTKIILVPFGAGTLLTALLIAVKATSMPGISWFLVFLPMFWWAYLLAGFITISIVVAIMVGIVFLGALTWEGISNWNKRRKRGKQ